MGDERPNHADQRNARDNGHASRAENGRQFGIYVNQSRIMRTYLGTILKCAGIQSIEAKDGIDALRVARIRTALT